MKRIHCTTQVAKEIALQVVGWTGHAIDLSPEAEKVYRAIEECEFKCFLVVDGFCVGAGNHKGRYITFDKPKQNKQQKG